MVWIMLDCTSANCVQWFHAHADMLRWQEEVETLEEEFRQVIQGLQTMEKVYMALAVQAKSEGKLKAGHAAFAL